MTATSIDVRRRPVQTRSKARVDAILNTARKIISEVGSDRLKMNALAQRAHVPIGTIYQFFPNKSAVIHTLVRATMDELSNGLQRQFQDVRSIEDAAGRLEKAVRGYCQILRDEPVTKDILCSTQGDKNLRALDQLDSESNGEMLFKQIKQFVDASHHDDFRTMCFLNAHLTGALARLCSSTDDKTAEAMQAQFIASAKRDLMAFEANGGKR